MKVRSLIPNYLEKQTPFIIQSATLTRALIITKAFNEGIIKDDKTTRKGLSMALNPFSLCFFYSCLLLVIF